MTEVFQNGEEASGSKLTAQLEALRTQGAATLLQIEQERLKTLVDFERRLSAMNGRRQRSNRVMTPRTAVRFVVSDFQDIDQAQTTATVRADAQAVTLREREVPSDATIREKRFSVNSGVAEAMGTAGNLYRAYSDDGTIPTGTFELELVDPLNLTLLVFDLAAMPSDPTIVVEVSSNGTTYVSAKQTNLNGYRLTAWLAPTVVRFVRVVLTPSHPDTLGGRSYTFGLMAFTGSTTEFYLFSELVTRPLRFRPTTPRVRLAVTEDPGLTYFLAFNAAEFVEVFPGQEIAIPGVSPFEIDSVDMDPDTGLLDHTLPATAYVETLWCEQEGSDDIIRIAPGLAPNSERDEKLIHKYLGVNGTALSFIRDDISIDIGKTFTVGYTAGPASVSVRLKVQLNTSDRTTTPVFRGAALEEIG